MSVKFYDKYNVLKKEFDTKTGEYETETLSSDILLYVDVKEGNIKLNFDLMDRNLGLYFPYQYDDGVELVEYERTLKEGKYRIILPTTKNEDMIKINFDSESGNIDADLYVVPNYFQY